MLHSSIASRFMTIAILPYLVNSLGRQNFECPDGFYLNIFNSMFGNDHRMYSFGCTPLASGEITKEKCEPGRISASNSNDMYMSCQNSQYVAGVSIIEDSKQQIWTLLCCQSPDVSISDECTSTIFLNEYKKGFSFASGAKHILRKWQSVYDEQKKDRRWWLQTCPFTTAKLTKSNYTTNDKEKSMNFTRKIAFPFDENRMTRRLSPKFTNFTISVNEHSTDDDSNLTFSIDTDFNEHDNISQINSSTESTKNETTKLTSVFKRRSHKTSPSTTTVSVLSNTNSTVMLESPWTSSSLFSPLSNSYTTSVKPENRTTSKKSSEKHSIAHKFSSYDDYYDSQHEKQLKIKQSSNGSKIDGIFKELHNVFKNIQDGLVLAQWVLSNNNDEKSKTVSVQQDVRSDTLPGDKLSNNVEDKNTSANKNKQKSSLQNIAEFFGITSLPSE